MVVEKIAFVISCKQSKAEEGDLCFAKGNLEIVPTSAGCGSRPDDPHDQKPTNTEGLSPEVCQK